MVQCRVEERSVCAHARPVSQAHAAVGEMMIRSKDHHALARGSAALRQQESAKNYTPVTGEIPGQPRRPPEIEMPRVGVASSRCSSEHQPPEQIAGDPRRESPSERAQFEQQSSRRNRSRAYAQETSQQNNEKVAPYRGIRRGILA